ncbi:flavin-containing monooxygenase [Nocardia stercoris]|uniref:NAD(P)/FAD-dependent oxidoreductase n=1 Tax=Nocardia stercoris TaxID=2483361 RepID=A0A3M2L164_9NOCA|nr:NAD(P)/FAD-dependent oxidoreductase [Nocardia stercoris]RMI31387.1 NAD(P)/FAD-dependent oxidoreductase [Nocardia stercoris]
MGRTTTFPGGRADLGRVRVAIIGAGFGGLGAAIRLRQAGIDDFVVLERATDVGGTWQANTYPGAQCDIPSMLYSFSFAPNPNWTRLYPLQPEIQRYLRDCVDRFGIADRLRLEHDVLDAAWDGQAQVWRIATDRGVLEATALIGAFGPFSAPATPDIPGLNDFRGAVFHTAEWNHEHDLAGERVAVIGTGASAVQVVPRLQPIVSRLSVFQRTPTWIMPHPDRPLAGRVRRMFESAPALQRALRTGLDLVQESLVPGLVWQPALLGGAQRLARNHLRRQVADPALRAALTPRYAFGCKRPTFSNAFYPALTAPNCDLVTARITEIVPDGIRTADGVVHQVDSIVLGTGFRLTDHPIFERLRGSGGRRLAQVWHGDARAYLGTMVSGFPNLFLILGPNSVTYTSQVVTIEAQLNYIVSALSRMAAAGLTSIDVRPEVQRAFIEEMDTGLRSSVWNAGGCRSYYVNDAGRNFVFYPGFSRQFKARLRRANLADFDTHRVPTPDNDVPEAVRTPR